MQELHIPAYLAAIKAHALANYEKDGWDYVVECYDNAQIVEIIKTARTIAGAIKMMRAHVKPRADYRAEIQAEAF
tara:strand:- start:2450 stop:2674 length:225 start_codon:yes stop_codon:yes gene_type:complete